MDEPFIGMIFLFAGNFPPQGFAFCNGQLMPITQNEALFQLIGTTYGGDGQSTFALPDLRGRVPVHMGNGYAVGGTGGVEEVTLTVQQIPAHTHTAHGKSNSSDSASPSNEVWGSASFAPYAASPTANKQMAGGASGLAGGSQPHDNMLPFLAVNFCIALFGIFPSRN